MKNSAHNFVTQVAKVIQNKEIEDKIAFIENGQTITYSELLTNAAQVAASLKKRGVQPGQRVTLVMSEGIDFVVTFLGILHLGAVAMPVNAWLGEKAVAQAIEVAESSMTVVSRSALMSKTFCTPMVTLRPCLRLWTAKILQLGFSHPELLALQRSASTLMPISPC